MLRRLVVTWLFNIVALWVAAELLSGIGYDDNEWVLVIAALVFSLANIFVKPIVILFTLPLVILTLGVALFFVNLLMLYLTSWWSTISRSTASARQFSPPSSSGS